LKAARHGDGSMLVIVSMFVIVSCMFVMMLVHGRPGTGRRRVSASHVDVKGSNQQHHGDQNQNETCPMTHVFPDF
jgi:hypothetical protein